MKHVLKTVNPYFEDVWSGKKNFEVRKDDRGFKVGDELILREYDKENGSYQGRQIDIEIAYILREFHALKENYVVLGFRTTDKWVPFGTHS